MVPNKEGPVGRVPLILAQDQSQVVQRRMLCKTYIHLKHFSLLMPPRIHNGHFTLALPSYDRRQHFNNARYLIKYLQQQYNNRIKPYYSAQDLKRYRSH